MYQYRWDEETGGLLLTHELSKFSKEPRPVYYQELDFLGFDKFWDYPKDDSAPFMWAETNNYFYKGRHVARINGGALFSRPVIETLEEPENNKGTLQQVKLEKMFEKNIDKIESLTQDAIKTTYNTYQEYKNKVDVFYVAFSGGKDSIVTLDIVQRALPHNAFKVLFGDTRMEFPDTYDNVDRVEQWCVLNGISFFRSQSEMEPGYTWNIIGPPAQKMRWCCSVHKTAPQILLLRKLTNNPRFCGMAMMGVRADESLARSQYTEVSYSTKHQGQYDFYPILNWGSAELFLYIYGRKLFLNETYKYGNSRAGCLVCPMATAKNNWFKEQTYSGSPDDSRTTTFYNQVITNQTFAKELPTEQYQEFMNIGVWKSRHNGTKLSSPRDIYHEEISETDIVIKLDSIVEDWKEWFKTLGVVSFYRETSSSSEVISVLCDKERYVLEHSVEGCQHTFALRNLRHTQKEIYFVSWLKAVLKKSAYCIACHVCEVNCPYGFIHMNNGRLKIEDKCIKCKKCYNVAGSCLVANSQRLPKETSKMSGSVDQYKNMGVRYSWVVDYLKEKDEFWKNTTLGSMMITSLARFLSHANVCERKKITPFGELLAKIGGENETTWALLLCNLVYTPQFNWWIKHIKINHTYFTKELEEKLKDEQLTPNTIKNVLGGFKNIFHTNPILSNNIKFGSVEIEEKGKNSFLLSVCRSSWETPDPRVILYSLYKFAEHCDGYHQFSLSTLLDGDEPAGVSPTQIFGLSREVMIPLLNGLSINYSDFISASFTLGLDTITLNADKTSTDVLSLF